MKTIKFLIIILFSFVLHTGCEKTTENVTTKIVEPHFATITLNGEEIVHIPVNGSYTESGAIGKDDESGATTNLTPISNDVDATTPGLYTVQYLTRNGDGYETTSTRYVAVTSVTNPIDYSGTYVRTTNGVEVIVTKVDDGVYKVQNPGGAPGADGI